MKELFKDTRKIVSDTIPGGWWGVLIGAIILGTVLLTPLVLFSTILWWLWGSLGMDQKVVPLSWWHCVGIYILISLVTDFIKVAFKKAA